MPGAGILSLAHEAYFKAIGEEPPGVSIEEFLQSVYKYPLQGYFKM
jgi:hypothetical protein